MNLVILPQMHRKLYWLQYDCDDANDDDAGNSDACSLAPQVIPLNGSDMEKYEDTSR